MGAADALSPAALRRRLEGAPCAARPWLQGDDGTGEAADLADGLTPAAVLIPLVERTDAVTVLLTQRTDHLRDHAGQISFPGGRIEPEDASIAAAALREAEEEIGLAPERVEVLGALAPYDTITGFRIHPVVGWVRPPFDLRLDPFEVADAFEMPLQFALDAANHRRQSYRRGSLTRSYYVLPFEGRNIWGATAGILVNLSSLLRA